MGAPTRGRPLVYRRVLTDTSPESLSCALAHIACGLHSASAVVKICLVESQGGIAPPTKRIIFNFAKEVGSPSAVDRTDYGTASGSARGFAQHHSQQLSRAAVSGDAQNINNAARNMRVAHSFMTGLNIPPSCARAF